MPSLLHHELNNCLRDHIHREFLAWTERHITGNPNKPACFDDYVLSGWQTSGGSGRKITFYEVFCLFFREELKHNEPVFRVFTADTLAGLQADMATVLANAPSAEDRARWDQSLRKLAGLDLTGFSALLESQNARVLDSLKRIEAGVIRLEAGQLELKAGMDLSLEIQQTMLDLLKGSQTVRVASKAEAPIPADIKGVLDEAEKLEQEGRYAEANTKFAAARQAAEAAHCVPALLNARIGIAEAQIHAERDVAQARDALLVCLRELSGEAQEEKRRVVLQLLGDAEMLVGSVAEAKSLYRQARQLAQKRQNRFSEALSLMGLSHAEEFLGDVKEAHRLLDEATELCRAEHRETTGKAKSRAANNLAASLSTKAILLRREGRLTDAVLCLAKAEPLFREGNSLDNLGRTLLFKAEALFNEAKRQEGLEALHEALSTFETIGNLTWQCRCLDRMAMLLFTEGNDAAALACLGKIIELLRTGQLEANAAPYLLKGAQLSLKHGAKEKAKGFIRQAKEIASATKDLPLLAECLIGEANTLGGSEAEAARNELFMCALGQLETALPHCDVRGRRAELMQRIGELHGWMKNVREARKWFEQALHEFEQVGDAAGVGESLGSLAAVAREEDSPEAAMAALQRLLDFMQGKPHHHLRAGALHDLGMLKLSLGDIAGAKRCLDDAKAIAEKHGIRDVLEVLKESEQRLSHAEDICQPPRRDIPSLINELHDWCAHYPKMRKAILPLWYYIHRAELWSICRSMLGLKFLVCAVDSAGFKRTADILGFQSDLCAWGVNFALRTKPATELIPWPTDPDFCIPKHIVVAVFDKLPPAPDDQAKALVGLLRDNAYVLVPFSGRLKEFPDTDIGMLGRHLRLAPMIVKMMLETPAKDLIANHRICLPLSERDEAPSLREIMPVAWENGMIPIVPEHLPHSDGIKAVCDCLVEIPNLTSGPDAAEPMASKVKSVWRSLLPSGDKAPQDLLSEFADGMAAQVPKQGGAPVIKARVFFLRFKAGAQEVAHPAVVLVSS